MIEDECSSSPQSLEPPVGGTMRTSGNGGGWTQGAYGKGLHGGQTDL